ncbi:hybrid sensor histidine kinase/response regulator transcription factor [Pelagicoccus mobilis]|uniref:histidine kinase n=1 Tax=Pelagicoccus mobilis TaxID=415221 RepID=A0A934VJ68_9BACT|nr:hybrid sensor histidine kinase/response regulator transcription factor [Pelagicoccus mobilis]MBK1875286.1 helix-turn-helix domain-containing protein [Pelagicoccus mobilis]
MSLANTIRTFFLLPILLHLNWSAAAPYTPTRALAIANPTRWIELEPLNQFKLNTGTEALDGTLFFATDQELIEYDGYQTKVHPLPDQSESNLIRQIYASLNGRIYILTTAGLYSFESGEWKVEQTAEQTLQSTQRRFATSPHGLEFVIVENRLYQIKGFEIELFDQIPNQIAEIAFDRKNRLWICDVESAELASFQFDHNDLSLPLETEAYRIFPGEQFLPRIVASPDSETVWAIHTSTDAAAYRFSNTSKQWIEETSNELNSDRAHVTGISPSTQEALIFTKAALFYYAENEWRAIRYPEFNPPSNNQFFFIRRNGNIVVGGYAEKTHEILYSTEKYENYTGLHFQCDGNNQSRWFLSVEGWIIENDPLYRTWTRHTGQIIDTPLSLFRDRDGVIWASGAHEGEAAVCYYDGTSWKLQKHPSLGNFISHLSAYQLSDGRVIFGSGDEIPASRVHGAVVYEKSGDSYKTSTYGPPFIRTRPVGFAETPDGGLWFGGVALGRTQSSLKSEATAPPPFGRERWIDHLSLDSEGRLWAALWERGLYRYDGESWMQISAPDQIASNQVAYILNDKIRKDSLWVATDKGISHFDGTGWHPAALPSNNRFSREGGTLKQSSDGAVWVNLASRTWYFRHTPNFQITKALYNSFGTIRHKLDGEPPRVRITSPLIESTSPANVFVQWSGSDRWSNTPESELRYSYRIDDNDWSPFDKQTNAVFLDLTSGEHRIQVRAMDLDGNISEVPAQTTATIIPPIWQRSWFIAIAFVILITFIVLIALLYKQRIRHIVQMDEFKLQFFTNISHELRTPLTVILGPLESHLAKMSKGEDRGPLELAYKNARKTLHLIDQLLDFRRAQTDKITLNLAHADLVSTVRESVELIRPLADDQSQTLELRCNQEASFAWFDPEKIDRIVNNLVSNAIKYTQKDGIISVRLTLAEDEEDVFAEIIVEDNGSGIPSRKIDNIFEVFYRAGNAPRRRVRGSGIGLAFTKTIVEACNGTINVESPITRVDGKQQGTRFTVSIPLKTHNLDAPPSAETIENVNEAIDEIESRDPATREKPCLLLAEDDSDIRNFVYGELKDSFDITTAQDGEIAWNLAQKLIPDIVVTDVMMPQMDGKQLCRTLKSEPLTSHIPVIMLTALKSEHHELEGLEHGADAYLTKPIRIPLLKQRIQNQLETLKANQQRFKSAPQEEPIKPAELTSNPLDEKFLQKAIGFVESCMDDPLLDVESLAREMGMSRMTLYRKTKAITGETPSQFIRSLRMKHALTLLQSREFTVSEVGYRVGFSDLSSFSSTFKKHVGRSPSEFLQGQ